MLFDFADFAHAVCYWVYAKGFIPRGQFDRLEHTRVLFHLRCFLEMVDDDEPLISGLVVEALVGASVGGRVHRLLGIIDVHLLERLHQIGLYITI